MMEKSMRKLFFDPLSGELRFDIEYPACEDIPQNIDWPNNLQRNNKPFGFKNLTLALTMKCNLQCDYCWQCHGNIADMDRGTIDKWLDFFLDNKNNSPNKILYYGGEPLLRIDLIEYASKRMRNICRNRGIQPVHQHIFTNATLLSDDVLDVIERENIYLILSIDGNPNVNAIHRHMPNGKNVEQEIIQGVERLRKRKITFGVCCTISEVEFDINSTVKYILTELCPETIELNLRHDKEFCVIAQKYDNQTLSSFIDAWNMIQFYGVKNIDLRKRVSAIAKKIPLQNSSSGSKNKLSIMPDGKISSFNGAVSYPELQITPEGDWLPQFQNRWDRNVLTNEKCQQCKAAFICGQGSAFSSFLQHGDFDHTPALHCEYCRTMLEYIIDCISDKLLNSRVIPYGYTVTEADIQCAFPNIL